MPMDKKFKEEMGILNSEQSLAVNTIDGPLLVVAGPGTGKTQLLSMRAANILDKTDTGAENILCLTFTNFAAINMRNRLYQLIGSTGHSIVVRTFHSLAAEIINEYPQYFFNGADLTIAPDAIQLEIIQEILLNLPLDNPLASVFDGSFTQLKSVKESLQLAKESGLNPDELIRVANHNLEYVSMIEPLLTDILSKPLSFKNLDNLRSQISNLPPQNNIDHAIERPLNEILALSLEEAIASDEPTQKTTNVGKWKRRFIQTVNKQKGMFSERKRNEWWRNLAEVYSKYRDELHHRGHYDYADMLIEVLEQLDKQTDMLADLQERYLYVQIDEFQDTTPAQFRLSRLIADNFSANGRPNLMAVGDDDQSIFAFNGADLNNTLEFKTNYPAAKIIVLNKNYRSSQAMMDVSSDIIAHAKNRLVSIDPTLDKHLIAKHDPPIVSRIEHLVYPTKQHEYYGLSETILNLRTENENNTIAVLARTHDSLYRMAAILAEKNIPVNYERRNDILKNEAVMTITTISRLILYIAKGDKNNTNIELVKLIRHPMYNVEPIKLWQIAIDNNRESDWLSYLQTHEIEGTPYASLVSWLLDLAGIVDTAPLSLMMEYILGLSEIFGFKSPVKDYYLTRKGPMDTLYLETLSAIETLRYLLDELRNSSPMLADLINFIDLNISTKQIITDESWFLGGNNAVSLLSVHKAKGLEFDTVFIIDAQDNIWSPKSNRRSSPANLRLQPYGEIEDDYVRLLYVAATRARINLTVASYSTDEKGATTLTTPYISHIKPTIIDPFQFDPVSVLETSIRWPRIDSDDEKTLLAPRLEEFSLSPSSLNNFLDITSGGPESFIDRDLLRLPRGSSPMGAYGSAIHKALQALQQMYNRDNIKLNKVLESFSDSLKKQSLTPTEFEQYYERGKKLITSIMDSDQPLLMIKGAKTEQTIADIMIGNARIKGTIDRLEIDTDAKSLIITDYKTGKSFRSFLTKDRSKALKAWKYSQQLLFYALLVKHSGRYPNNLTIRARVCFVEAEDQHDQFINLEVRSEELQRLEKLIQSVWSHIASLTLPDTQAYTKDIDGILKLEMDLISEFDKQNRRY